MSRAKGSVLGLLLLGLVAVTQSACPQAVPAVGPSASCVTTVITDALKGMTTPEIIQDAGPGCVKDAEEVAAILAGSTNPQVPTTKAFGEVKTLRASKGGS